MRYSIGGGGAGITLKLFGFQYTSSDCLLCDHTIYKQVVELTEPRFEIFSLCLEFQSKKPTFASGEYPIAILFITSSICDKFHKMFPIETMAIQRTSNVNLIPLQIPILLQ